MPRLRHVWISLVLFVTLPGCDRLDVEPAAIRIGIVVGTTYRDQGGDPPRRLIIARVRQGKTAKYEEVTP